MDTLTMGNKKCRYCGEDVQNHSRRCPYCGSLLESGSEPTEIKSDTKPETISDSENQNFDNESMEQVNEFGENQVTIDSLIVDDKKEENTDTQMNQQEKVSDSKRYPVSQTENIEQLQNEETGTLSNGVKVFLTTLSTVIPGLGQLIGIIVAIVFMNAQGDKDKNSFGTALMISSIVVFVATFIFYFVLILTFSTLMSY